MTSDIEESITIDDPLFAKRVYQSHLHTATNLFEEEYFEISELLDATEIQESCAVRNILRARNLAGRLINEQGELLLDLLPELIQQLSDNLYSLGPNRHHDALRDSHMLDVLKKLATSKELQRLVKNMSRPVSNRRAEDIVRESLNIASNIVINDSHVRRACLATWLTYLRQSLGSCFATAPAIIIQQEQPALFLKDLDEMMSTGRLKRTFGGIEYSVPMSMSWGNGDLKKPIILRQELELNDNKVWCSYGIIQGLEAVGILDKELALTQKVKQCRELFEKCYPSLAAHRPLFVTNAEDLIQTLLLQHHGITKKEVEQYLQKPKSMMIGGGLLYVPSASKKEGNKKDPCIAYLEDMELAKTAFKTIADNALIKSWEFTLASFSEIKLDFAKYNLYTSLGVNFDDKGGIGECLYQLMSLKIEQANTALQALTDEYNQAVTHMNYLQGRAKMATTEKEIEWMKMEYQSRQAELYHIEQQKDIAYEKANKIAHLHEFLIGEYDKKFRDYFQEVYDAEIHDIASGPFDDSPAGFRLLFKHGRSNPSQWSYIYSPAEFVEALVSFFTITEHELREMPQVKNIEQDFSLAITQLVNHVRSDEFLESSFFRMARAHGSYCPAKPLQHLDQVEKKPWVYTSGGSMSILVSAYFKNDQKPFEISRWVEHETEFFAWLIDSLRQLPAAVTKQYLDNPNKSMLMHSPTHAFSMKPGYAPFKESWMSDMYSYSWIKMHVTEPAKNFYKDILVDNEMMQKLGKKIREAIHHNYRPRFDKIMETFKYQQSLKEFYGQFSRLIFHDRGLKTENGSVVSADLFASLLHSEFPYTEWTQVRSIVEEIGRALCLSNGLEQTRFDRAVSKHWKIPSQEKYISCSELIYLIEGLIVITVGKSRYKKDIVHDILGHMRKKGCLGPRPVIFADTNWIKDFFAFVVNPGNLELEFWSVDAYGLSAKPVSHWKMWLNGTRKEPDWGVFSKPHEYVGI